MDGQQKISPQELFYIGKYMRAQYIDYDYVRLMGDLTRKYSLKEKEIMAGPDGPGTADGRLFGKYGAE